MRALLVLALAFLLASCGEERSSAPPADPAPDAPPSSPPADPEQEMLALSPVGGADAFRAHHDATLAVYFAPDGRSVLTTSLDTTARLWNLEGEQVAVLEGHVASIHQAAFSPDGTSIVTASVDHTARLWETTGALRHVFRHDAEVRTATFTPDGKHVLTLSFDGTAVLWATDDGKAVLRTAREDDPVEAAWAKPDASEIVVVRAGGTASGLDTDDASTIVGNATRAVVCRDGPGAFLLPDRAPLDGHEAPVLDAAFSPDAKRVATASLDETARVWGLGGSGGDVVLRGHRGGVFSVSFAPDGERVLTVSSDRTARVWDRRGREIAVLGSKADAIATAAFSPTGDFVLTTPPLRGPAKVWDLDGRVRYVLPDATGRTHAATFSPDGTRIVTIDRSLTPHLWALDGDAAPADPAPSDFVEPAVPPLGDYAGTVVCASCHREAYEGWFHSSHARTSYFPNEISLPPDVLAEKTVSHPPFTTTFRKDGDAWIARTTGEDGELHDYPLTMVSGWHRVRFFVSRFADGRLQVMPAMYELPTGEWFDYSHLIFGADTGDFLTPPTIEPGSETFWTGPARSWDASCAHCHMSGKRPLEPAADGTGPRIIWRALAVDCEACHGPGRRHAEAWQRLEMDASLPKLETLPRDTRTAVCTQCHQEGEVLEPPYVLGQDLYDYIDPTLVVDPERADPAGRALELIYDGTPFATSTCAHAGGLTCSDCHVPHGSKLRSLLRKPADDASLCADCHAGLVANAAAHHHHDEGGSGASCILCHLPFLTIERGHGAVADHTIGIPRIGLSADRTQPDACTWCHSRGLGAPDDAPLLGEEALKSTYAAWWPDQPDAWPQPWMAALARGRLQKPGAGPPLVAVIEDSRLPREVRASAAWLLRHYAADEREAISAALGDADSLVRRSAVKALAALEGAWSDERLLEALDDPTWAVRLAAARAALEGWTRVQGNRPLLEKVVPVLAEDARKVPDDDLRWFRLGAAYDLLGDKESALQAYERKAALDPFATAVHRHVKDLRALLGKDLDEDD